MDWLCLKMPFREGPRFTLKFQERYMAAYMAHLASGRGLLRESAVFGRGDFRTDSYEFYFAPQMIELVGRDYLEGLGAAPCDRPHPGSRETRDGISLLAGEATAWELVQK